MTGTTIRIGDFIEHTRAEGPGLRFAVWFQGCSILCPGCVNPRLLKPEGGRSMKVRDLLTQLDDARKRFELRGLTCVGGEPFDQPEGLNELLLGARTRGLDTLVFTGFTLDQLGSSPALEHIDALVDGPFVATKRTESLYLRGSTNQTVHHLTDRFTEQDFNDVNRLEVHVIDGQLQWAGFPFASARHLVEPDR